MAKGHLATMALLLVRQTDIANGTSINQGHRFFKEAEYAIQKATVAEKKGGA